jgi:hypothetical protein
MVWIGDARLPGRTRRRLKHIFKNGLPNTRVIPSTLSDEDKN